VVLPIDGVLPNDVRALSELLRRRASGLSRCWIVPLNLPERNFASKPSMFDVPGVALESIGASRARNR